MSEQRESITLFADVVLGKLIPRRLRAESIAIERLLDHFPAETPDTEWIPVVAQQGWYALTLDHKLRANPLERNLVMESGLAVFQISAPGLTNPEIADLLIEQIHRILSFARRHPPPFFAVIYQSEIRM